MLRVLRMLTGPLELSTAADGLIKPPALFRTPQVRQRLSGLEAGLAELNAPPKASREWEGRLAAAAARVDAKLAEMEAAAEARLREAAAALESGLAERCHGAHVELREASTTAASRLGDVERRLRSLDEFARGQNAAPQVGATRGFP